MIKLKTTRLQPTMINVSTVEISLIGVAGIQTRDHWKEDQLFLFFIYLFAFFKVFIYRYKRKMS